MSRCPTAVRVCPVIWRIPSVGGRVISDAKHISLALQGGGSHGAFAWGVMHRLISEPRLYIDGLSGTSAGAMNAVVFAAGFIKGSRQGAINALVEFWGRVAERCTVPRSAMSRLFGAANAWQVDSEPDFMMVDFMTRIWSPSQLNPSSAKPLRETAAISAIRRSIR